jgi:hypothetical protein
MRAALTTRAQWPIVTGSTGGAPLGEGDKRTGAPREWDVVPWRGGERGVEDGEGNGSAEQGAAPTGRRETWLE